MLHSRSAGHASGDGFGNGFGNAPGSAESCLGRSCLKWAPDGELSALDLQSILERLSAVDEQASGLLDCPVEPV